MVLIFVVVVVVVAAVISSKVEKNMNNELQYKSRNRKVDQYFDRPLL